MRADERQAAVAYTYAWWLTGDDDAAADAVRTAIMAPAPTDGSATEVVLARRVREHVGDRQAMPPSSEMTLLHDGLDLELEAAAAIAGVAADDVPAGLAHGRLEALLETVRDPFEHPERLGGLALGDAGDMDHARQCPSCARARTLLERGRTELREVVSVSAPAGLLAQLVQEAAAAEPAAGPVTEIDITNEAAAAAPPDAVAAPETVAAPDDAEAPPQAPVAAAIDAPPAVDAPVAAPAAEDVIAEDVVAEDVTADDLDTEIVLDEPPTTVDVDLGDPAEQAAAVDDDVSDTSTRDDTAATDVADAPALEDGAAVEQDDVIDVTEAPPRRADQRVATTPAQKRVAGALAGAGILTVCLLVAVLVGSSGDDSPDLIDDPATENPVMEPDTQGSSQQPEDDGGGGDGGPAQGPPGESPRDFRVVQTGVLLPGDDAPAASGAEVGPDDLLRIAVDYEGATDGVQLTAIWRVDEEDFDRLDALVSGRSSRHVWGVTPPEGGWPAGQHRIVLTADDSVAGAVDFTVTG